MFNNAIPFNPATNYQRGFQDPASPVAEGISAFHNDLRVLVRFILGFVVYAMYHCLTAFAKDVSEVNAQNSYHLEDLEEQKSQKFSTTTNRLTHETILEIV